jgi:hypothetical protein
MMCVLLIILIILVILIILILINNNIFNNREHFIATLPSGIDNATKHVFWTGGYDSTFRVCQLLVDKQIKVQPIYVIYKYIDDTEHKTQRNNKDSEVQTMSTIRSYLHTKFPYTKNLLLPTIYVNHLPENKAITNSYTILHYRFGKFSRPITQYERLARFSQYYPYPIDVSVEKCRTGMDDATKDIRIDEGTDDCRVPKNLSEDLKTFAIFNKLRFPIVHLRKKDMHEIAKKGQYDDILKLTWSCWFPKYDGSPCGNCDMCAHRIVPQYNRNSLYYTNEKIKRDKKTIDNSLEIKYVYY